MPVSLRVLSIVVVFFSAFLWPVGSEATNYWIEMPPLIYSPGWPASYNGDTAGLAGYQDAQGNWQWLANATLTVQFPFQNSYGPAKCYGIGATTDANGSFLIHNAIGGGCVPDWGGTWIQVVVTPQPPLEPAIVEPLSVYPGNPVTALSPDKVNDRGELPFYSSNDWLSGNIYGSLRVGLSDVVHFTNPIKTGEADFCTDFAYSEDDPAPCDTPGGDCVGVEDAVFLTPIIKAGYQCFP